MVNVKQLIEAASEPHSLPNQDDLRKEVERLRLEVELASRSIIIDEGNVDVDIGMPPEAIARGFNSPDDFAIKERSLKYADGSTYNGDCLGSLRHGKGTYTRADGAVYTGEWSYDAIEGHASAIMPDGQTYDGEWRSGKAHGHGKATYSNGAAYEGDFENDGRHGWGVQRFASGEVYEGEWAVDKIHGQGRWTYPDGTYYEGEWREGARHHGRLVSSDGSEEYSGQWDGIKRSGQGVQYRRGAFKYAGEWKNDLQHGRGRCVYADNSVYDGEWAQGERCSRGKFTSAAGGKYDGEWSKDLFHGQGCMVGENGDRYVGGFDQGQRSGFGRCVYPDGSKYEGRWKEGLRDGQGLCSFANGDVYNGEWAKDKRHGAGVCRFADGTKFRGRWEDDGWVQSAADPGRCRVAGAGVTRALAGRKAAFKILARDADGNRRLDGGDEFQVMLRKVPDVAGEVVGLQRVEDEAKGVDEGEHTSEQNDKDVSREEGEEEKEGNNASSGATLRREEDLEKLDEAAAADRQHTTNPIAATGATAPCAAAPAPYGGSKAVVAVTGSEQAFTAPAPVTLTASVKDNDDGTYDVEYTATMAGLYELSILMGGNEHVADSPYPLRVNPATPCARKCIITGQGRTLALAGTGATFEIIIRDAYENQCIADGDGQALLDALEPLEVFLEGGSGGGIIPVIKRPTRNGRLMCTYEAPAAVDDGLQWYRLHVLHGTKALPGTPYSVRVVASVGDYAALSSGSKASQAASHPGSYRTEQERDGQMDGSCCASNVAKDSFTKEDLRLQDGGGGGVKDEVAIWERIAAAAYAADGGMEGWESDGEGADVANKGKNGGTSSAEDAYLQSHPDVPVVENLEDLWLVSKLQRERKLKEESEKRKKLDALREGLEAKYGPGEAPPREEEAAEALRVILQQEKEATGRPTTAESHLSIDQNTAPRAHASPLHTTSGTSRKITTRADLVAVAASLDELA